MGTLLVLGLRVRVSCGRSDVAHCSMEIGDKSPRCERTDADAYDAPGRTTKRKTWGVIVMMEVNTDADP